MFQIKVRAVCVELRCHLSFHLRFFKYCRNRRFLSGSIAIDVTEIDGDMNAAKGEVI